MKKGRRVQMRHERVEGETNRERGKKREREKRYL